jgi:hypothetical protein
VVAVDLRATEPSVDEIPQTKIDSVARRGKINRHVLS